MLVKKSKKITYTQTQSPDILMSVYEMLGSTFSVWLNY